MQDVVGETDWAAAWRDLVEARAAFSGPRTGYWDRRASTYAASMTRRRDGVLEFLEQWMSTTGTLIDVGAGTGRFAAPLADRLEWVTAVEPSEGMRALIPHRDNMTVIASGWEEAEVAPADFVLCSHVVYGVADVVPFLRKLEAAARRRVFVVLRARQLGDAPDRVAVALNLGRPRQPELLDLLLVLRQLAVDYEVSSLRYPVEYRYANFEDAVDDCRGSLGGAWDDRRGRHWLDSNLKPDPDGGFLDWRGEMVSGVVHWRPTGSS
jgi:SAM-dependent methyltransferase